MTVNIQVIVAGNWELEKLGLESGEELTTVKLTFKPEKLSSFWVSPDQEELHFVVDAMEYMCANNDYLRAEFKKIINGHS